LATILRTWSYQYPWLYATISQIAALGVGGEARFHQLPLQDLDLAADANVLDLCCGGGQATRYLVKRSPQVIGLDASPVALARAKKAAPQAQYVQGQAEALPFASNQFDLVHTSVALHEMTEAQRQQIFAEVYRVLKRGGIFTLMDFHRPTFLPLWLPLALFLGLFETETAWQWMKSDSLAELQSLGFHLCRQSLYAGGSLQVVQVKK
jgi:ubiquinone/menaquinone biosynthesis C-methylase UbiE